MMAFDRSPETPVLDAATVVELRAALSRSLRTGNHGEELNRLLVQAAQEAREKGLRAEQLLVALKAIWFKLPQLSTVSSHDVQTQLLQQLVARCIHEYYAE